MAAMRVLGNVLLWVVAVLGVLAGAIWVANKADRLLPVVVVSGSMEPGIRTGDLLIATRTEVEDLRPGDIATLPSPARSGTLVTHRVVSVAPREGGVAIRMKGDANTAIDPGEYVVRAGDSVWTPSLTIPKAGTIATTLTKPGVAIPLMISIGALIALSSIPPPPRARPAKEPEASEPPEPSDPSVPPEPPPEPSLAGAGDQRLDGRADEVPT